MISCSSDELTIVRAGEGIQGKDCGKKILKYCFHCNNHFFGKHYCMSRDCPNCYDRWAWREALPATEKILFNRKARKIIHGVVSIPDSPKNILENRKHIYRLLKEHDIESGVLIPHHERHGVYDGYLHYHFLAYIRGRYRPGNYGEWYIFKKIRTLKGAGDVANTIHYFLTHCAIVNNKHSITYFGEKFKKIKKVYKSNDQLCSLCGEFASRVVPIVDFNSNDIIEIWDNKPS